jgi:hypothetical protein
MSWKVFRWYLVAGVATVLACLLWLVVFAEVRETSAPPPVIVPYVPPGRLPVVPVLRPASSSESVPASTVGPGTI